MMFEFRQMFFKQLSNIPAGIYLNYLVKMVCEIIPIQLIENFDSFVFTLENNNINGDKRWLLVVEMVIIPSILMLLIMGIDNTLLY